MEKEVLAAVHLQDFQLSTLWKDNYLVMEHITFQLKIKQMQTVY